MGRGMEEKRSGSACKQVRASHGCYIVNGCRPVGWIISEELRHVSTLPEPNQRGTEEMKADIQRSKRLSYLPFALKKMEAADGFPVSQPGL